MKKHLSRRHGPERSGFWAKLYMPPAQRRILLKWLLFTLSFLLLQVLQDVVFSRITIFGGCPDVVPVYLLLVCMTQELGSGALFVLCTGAFRALCGAVLGPVSLLVLVVSGVGMSLLRGEHLWGRVRATFLCTGVCLALHQGVIFALGLFLGYTHMGRLPAALGGLLGMLLVGFALYPLVRLIGKIGGTQWKA